ncbi:MAG: DUF5803 family protein [Candidatus Methanoperedens sp.]|nr:DUF5803 family protein [Candidatus Methanoperedens sp.]
MKLLILILLVLASGCVSPPIQTGSPEEYELPGLDNTTVFYLNLSSVQVVENVINATTTKFIIMDKTETNFRDPIAVDYSGNNVSFNVSKVLFVGKNFARFEFSSPFSGFVAFTQSGGQDFSYLLMKNGSIRVVLPVNYTSQSRFLGVALPRPDNITKDAKGREVLIWENPYPEHKSIRVKYSHEDAPTLLFYFFFSLFIFAAVVLGYYYLSLNTLKKKRTLIERDVRK